LTHQVEQSLAQHGDAVAAAEQADGRAALTAVRVAIDAGADAEFEDVSKESEE
jgi:hypothetical protein